MDKLADFPKKSTLLRKQLAESEREELIQELLKEGWTPPQATAEKETKPVRNSPIEERIASEGLFETFRTFPRVNVHGGVRPKPPLTSTDLASGLLMLFVQWVEQSKDSTQKRESPGFYKD